MKLLKPILGLILTQLLIACGQSGPLYLPDEPPPIHVEKEK